MTIGFDGSRAFHKNKTGTENYSYQLLLHLAQIDTNNQYVVYLRPGTQGEALQGWPANFQFKIINWPRLWTQAGLAGQTFKDNLDVLFIPAHTSPLIHKPGLKIVVTVHDLGAEYLPQMHQLKQQLYLKWITKFQLKSATKLIAVSKATKNDLIERVGCDEKKVEVVYEGYDQKLFKPVKADILVNGLKQFNLVPGKYFLFVGTIQPRKNLDRLIKAFAIHLRGVPKEKRQSHLGGEVKLVIAGQKGWLADEIYNAAEADKVKFLGRVSDKDLPALYSGAIALTFPSLFEGFGLPILEAQACGCPVLTSNLSSMPEVAGKAAVYVNPTSTEDIIRGILRLPSTGSTKLTTGPLRTSRSGQVREKLIKAGFENIKRFSWEKCARKTLKVLEEVGSG